MVMCILELPLVIGQRNCFKKLRSPQASDEKFVAIVENDSLGVDAIQVVTGYTMGKGNSKCGEMVAENRARIKNGDVVCIPCLDN